MAVEVGKAYVQIVPNTKGIKAKLNNEFSSSGASAGDSFGSEMVSKLKGIIAAAGIGAMVKEALDAGGALQQSFGGIDTLYENTSKTIQEFQEETGLSGKALADAFASFKTEASDSMKAYAREAAKAGISMNDYAEQAVSFGAALKSAFSGDVTKAAEAANTAIMDMADNSAKMGTDITAVQNAYQGFAKQNYTIKLMSAA